MRVGYRVEALEQRAPPSWSDRAPAAPRGGATWRARAARGARRAELGMCRRDRAGDLSRGDAVRSRLYRGRRLLALWMVAIGGRSGACRSCARRATCAAPAASSSGCVELEPPRGTIYDARGRELAVSVEVESAFAEPARGRRPAHGHGGAARAGSSALDRKRLERRSAPDREFVWVARKLDPPVARAVRALELPGVYFLERASATTRCARSRRSCSASSAPTTRPRRPRGDVRPRGRRPPGRRTVLRDARRGSPCRRCRRPSRCRAATST
jgi:hypothetical protein